MKKREKILASIIGGMALLLLGYLGIKALLLKPLREVDRQTAALRDRLRQIHDDRRAFFSGEDFLKSIVPRTFGRAADIASAQAGEMITDQILRLGLREEQFSRTPVGPRRLRGAQEVGWTVQGEGPLAKMVDLLFLLEQIPQIHRLENVVVSAADRPGRAKIRFRYLTLVIESAPVVAPVELKPHYTLASEERRFYNAIIQRDLLRPYVKRVAVAGQTSGTPPLATETSPATGARPELLKVVSLSQWQGVAEVHLCNMTTLQVTRLKPGDTLADGQVVMIDYRPRPLRDKPELLSYSRVILKIGSDYWAIENGQTLAAKYQLTQDQWPPELTPISNPQQ